MNRMNNFLLMGSVALSGIVAFSACSSENDMGAEVNPTFDGKTVKTQFALNVPYGNTGTRMSADATQQNSNFLGIKKMTLLPFAAEPAEGKISTSLIDLKQNTNAFESDGTGQGRYIYRDVEIPIGTTHFVFYGEAKDTPDSEASDNCFTNGFLTPNLTGPTVELNSVSFKLHPIAGIVDFTTDDKGKNVLKALNEVSDTKYIPTGETAIEWKNITETSPQLDHAKKLWETFKKLNAGSAASVRIALENLKKSTGVATTSTGTDKGTKLLIELVKKIDMALNNELKADNTFPANVKLPDGAAAVEYNGGTWKFKSPALTTGEAINYEKITYPASLKYFVSTPAKTKDNASTGISDPMWPAKDKWTVDQTGIWTGWDNDVKNTTRTIALEKAIQYGVANLKLTIKAKNATLEDNAKTLGGQVENQFVDVNTNKFTMTGVLIGGQPAEVDWKLEPKATDQFDNIIYDKTMNGGTITVPVDDGTGTASTPNYTLVLDNNNNASAKSIYVAVELVNNTGIDFYGKDGMIPAGGKFYLVGLLNPEAPTGVTNKTSTINRVFLKDYTTKANLTIKDLKNAYNVIPDLRSTAISVGLAVNLEWQNGITFDVEI